MIERDGEDLVRTKGRIIPLFTVDNVVQVISLGVPEAAVKGGAGLLGVVFYFVAHLEIAGIVKPLLEQSQGVVPQGVDFDSLLSSASGGDHPITDFGVHPGQLINQRRYP